MLHLSEISLGSVFSHFKKTTTHFYPKTISGNTIQTVILHLASTAVYLREKKILANENVHHSDKAIPLHEEKRDTRKWASASLGLVSNFFTLS